MWKFIENKSFLRSTTTFVITIILFFFVVIIIGPVVSLILIYRWLVGWAAKLFQPRKLGKLVTSTSAVFASGFLYSRKAVNIVNMAVIDSPTLDVDKFRSYIDKELLSATLPNSSEPLYPECKSTFVSWMGFLFWAPSPKFDIRDHVKSFAEIDAPPFNPEDPTSVPRLITYLTRDRIWEKRKPLWEIILIENAVLSAEGAEHNKSFFCFRCHHSMADGWSLLKVTLKLFGKPEMLKKMPQFRPPHDSGWKGFMARVWLLIKLPFVTVDHVLTVVSNKTTVPELAVPSAPPDYDTDMYGCLEEIQSLDYFKRLKKKLGIDFHSTIVAGIAAAVRNSYQIAGQKVPENVRFSFPLPMPGHPDKLRNHATMGIILLPIGEPDSLKRAKMISSRIQAAGIKSGLPLSTYYLFRLLGCMPHAVLSRSRGRVSVPPILFTNTVATSEPLYWANKLVSDVHFSINIPFEGPEGYAFGVGLMTYCGRVKFGVAGLRHYFPTMEHAKQFLDWCVEEWKYLETLEIDETKIETFQIV